MTVKSWDEAIKAKWQFELWRLAASVTCFATALGLLRFVWMTAPLYGGGLLPAAAVVIAVALVVAGVGVFFFRERESLSCGWL